MAKVKRITKNEGSGLSGEDMESFNQIACNASLMRSTLLNKLIDSRRDIDLECGYPKEITTQQYKLMYAREGLASRVVSLFPEESWAQDPEVWETEAPEATEFEEAVKNLDDDHRIWSYLSKIDEISGIGRFGLVLLGINDGKNLDEPVEGIDEKGEETGTPDYELLFLRVFDESVVTIKGLEKDPSNPRFGQPVLYSVSFDSVAKSRTATGEISEISSKEQMVHWTRVIHIADNRKTSEVYGIPRMQTLFNRLYDIRKIVGGSGEMFWKGGFPGYSFEMDANARPLTDPQKKDLREQFANYSDGLQRYLSLQGVSAKSLAPQVASPKVHMDVQLEIIAITLGVPKRIFMGSEQAKLASSQDTDAWNKRVARRQNRYVTPYIIRPFIDRMIAFGALPAPNEEERYSVTWPDLAAPSEKDRAEVLQLQTEAFAKYVAGNVDQLIAPESFLSMFAKMTPDQIQEIMDAVLEREKELEDDEDEDEDDGTGAGAESDDTSLDEQ